MAINKLVIRYKFATRGWTEVFYVDVPVNQGSTAEVLASLVTPSLACRHPGVNLVSMTLSEVANPRKAHIERYNAVAPGIAGATPDITAVAARIGLTSGEGANRKCWVRGLNDTWTIRDAAGNDTPSNTLLDRLNTYIGAIVFRSLRIAKVQGVAMRPWVAVGSAQGQAFEGRDWLRLNMPSVFSVGQRVALSRFPQTFLGGARGSFSVIAVGSGYVVVNYPWGLGAITIPLTGARVRQLLYDYPAITGGGFEVLTTHDTGRPTDLPRGRRSGAAIRR